MTDNSKEGLVQQKKNPIFVSSFDSISEKQEEMSMSSIQGKEQKLKRGNNDNIKKILDEGDIKFNGPTNLLNQKLKKRSELIQMREEKKDEFKKFSISKKNQRNSVQERGLISHSLIQLNTSSTKDKFKKSEFKQSLKYKKSLTRSFFSRKKSVAHPESFISKNTKSLSEQAFEMDYINKAGKKNTILHSNKLDFSEKGQMSVLDEIRNSEYYEKSENLIFKLKLFYAVLALFSVISITLNCADSILYNNNSVEYLNITIHGTKILNKEKTSYYGLINKRKISSRENTIRVFNAIFSLLCVLLLIIIYGIKTGMYNDSKINTKKERLKRILNQYYSKQRKKSLAKNKMKKGEQKDRNYVEKVKIVDLNSDKNESVEIVSKKNHRTTLIKRCIVNVIFYPPFINKCIVGKYKNI